MRTVSKKRAKQLRAYKKVRDQYMFLHPNCVRCKREASEIHHKKGRMGELLTNTKYFISVCRECHHFIETNPVAAKMFGYSLDRL
jgi:hypothetical protein